MKRFHMNDYDDLEIEGPEGPWVRYEDVQNQQSLFAFVGAIGVLNKVSESLISAARLNYQSSKTGIKTLPMFRFAMAELMDELIKVRDLRREYLQKVEDLSTGKGTPSGVGQ